MSYAAVVNRNSGYVMAKSPATVRAMLENATHGELGSLRMVAGAEVEAALKEAFDSRPSAVIVLGGDGTARSAAAHARRSETPFIPLPGGTMNLLPRRLYGDGDPAECLSKALKGSFRRLDAGCAGEHLFFLQGFFGVAPNIARAREAVRELTSLDDLPGVFGQARKALKSLSGHGLTYHLGKDEGEHKAETLVVSIGSLDDVMSPSPRELEHSFEVIGVDVHNLGEIARLGFNALMQHWRDDPGVEVARATELSLHLCEHDPCAVLDGEPVELPVDVTVRYLRDAIPVVVPAG